jgi:hypothetical protein
MRKQIAATVLATVCVLSPSFSRAADAPALPPRVFSHPDRIRYDSQCFTIEGKDTFIFSGAFHYFRCPKELWSDRFDKIKAAGFNAVETYAAWNDSEPEMPASVDDYSKINLKDLDDWLTMAEAKGLYVIFRPGPYICAEWDCGGFPQWLLAKRPADYKGMWLRSDEPSFVAWSKHWYHAVDQIAVKHQLTKRAPGTHGIILYQLENEYGGNQPDAMEVRYLHALGQQALDDGIDVPFFTCWTGVVRGSSDPILRQAYDSCNFYPRWDVDSIAKEIAKLDREQPDAPRQTTELQGGWFSNPGDAASLSTSWTDVIDSLSPAQIQNLTLYAIEKGDRITNYYMAFGGTNFGDRAPSGITTSYDYSAPIREIGSVGEKYQRVAAIGAMLKEHGQSLARAVPIECDAKTDQKDVTVAARMNNDDEPGWVYLFFRTNQHTESRKGTASVSLSNGEGRLKNGGIASFKTTIQVNYDLEPFGSKIYHVQIAKESGPLAIGTKVPPMELNASLKELNGEWLPKPVAEIKRPTEDLPTSIKLTQALTKPDPGPVKWEPLKDSQTLEDLGVYGRRFVFYRAQLNLDAKQPATLLNILGAQRDNLLASINGTVDPKLLHPGAHRESMLHGGDNTLDILYENIGEPNYGPKVEEMAGITRIETLVDDGSITDWKMLKLPPVGKGKFRPERLKEIKPDFDDSGWTATKIENDEDAKQMDENQTAVFRASVNISADQIKSGDLNLQLSRMDDGGTVFVNGTKIGEGHDWASVFTFPATNLHEGKNSIAVVVRNESGDGGLGGVKLLKTNQAHNALPIEIGTESVGYAGQWWKSDLDETSWQAQPIGEPAASGTQLNWYRTKFELPVVKKGIWVPWVARLTTSGNGFLYLNDHPLGRYWQEGPQHDFFLPECWLNFGPGKSNVLSLCLRSVDGKPIKVESAEIVPVNEVAEYR